MKRKHYLITKLEQMLFKCSHKASLKNEDDLNNVITLQNSLARKYDTITLKQAEVLYYPVFDFITKYRRLDESSIAEMIEEHLTAKTNDCNTSYLSALLAGEIYNNSVSEYTELGNIIWEPHVIEIREMDCVTDADTTLYNIALQYTRSSMPSELQDTIFAILAGLDTDEDALYVAGSALMLSRIWDVSDSVSDVAGALYLSCFLIYSKIDKKLDIMVYKYLICHSTPQLIDNDFDDFFNKVMKLIWGYIIPEENKAVEDLEK